MVFSSVLENKIYMKSTTPVLFFNTATTGSCCGHISSHRRISQSHITSLAGIAFSREVPPTSSTATGTIQRNFTSQIHASMSPNTNSGPPGNHTPIDGLQIWVFVGSGEEKDSLQSKNGILLLLIDFLIIWTIMGYGAVWRAGHTL